MRLVFENEIGIGACRECHILRIVKIDAVLRDIGRQERICLRLFRNLNRFVGMRQHKAVEIDHDRRGNAAVLRNAPAHQREVERFLRILRIDLNPAAVEL